MQRPSACQPFCVISEQLRFSERTHDSWLSGAFRHGMNVMSPDLRFSAFVRSPEYRRPGSETRLKEIAAKRHLTARYGMSAWLGGKVQFRRSEKR